MNTLEVGLAHGASALLFASEHQLLGRPPAGQHVAIDPFQKEQWDEVALVSLERAGLRDFVTHYEGFSCTVLPELFKRATTYQMVYIDGSHLFEDVFVDWFYVDKVLDLHSIVAFDDSSHPDVRKLIRFLDNNFAHKYRRLDLLGFREESQRGLKYRIAKFVRGVQLTAYQKIASGNRPWNAKLVDF